MEAEVVDEVAATAQQRAREDITTWFHRWRYRVPQRTELGYRETMDRAPDDLADVIGAWS